LFDFLLFQVTQFAGFPDSRGNARSKNRMRQSEYLNNVIEQNHKLQYSEKNPERDGGDEDNSQPGKGNQLRVQWVSSEVQQSRLWSECLRQYN